ncbi:hypothetical protein EP7_004337 [Isosphaeraceae bacterium EP7]
MSIIGFNGAVAGVVKGNTYGTEADITAGGINLYASSISPSGGYADFVTRDFGQGGKRTNNARLAASFDCSLSFDWTFSQAWQVFLAGILGTEATPSETTVGQGDYLHKFDVADSIQGLFYTVVYSIESDRTMVIPSFTPTSITIAAEINGPGTVTVQGVADNVKESSMNTVAEVTALVDYPYESVVMGGANQYTRIHNYSTGSPLSSTHDKEIAGFTLTVSRQKDRRYGMRGALSKFTKEPLELGLIDATLTVRHTELDNAGFDILDYWTNPSYKMGEFYFDGSQIGSGVNASYKLQFPSMKVKGAFPGGHGISSNRGLFTPDVTFDLFKAAAAPSGMTGVTELLRVSSVNAVRSAKWGT